MMKTARLRIRPVRLGDAVFIQTLVNTADWKRYIGDRQVHTLADAEGYITAKMLPQYERLGFGNYVIELRACGTPVGTVGLYDRQGLVGVDLGYALLPAYYGQGYAIEAARCMLTLAETKGYETIQAITTPDNEPSRRLLELLGFVLAGTVILPGDEAELLHYHKTLE